MSQRRVRSADGTELAVYESGDPKHPTIVALHGYPDNHHVWDGVVELLAPRYRVVTYDVRGAGESDQPKGRSAYTKARLADDFVSVLDAISPDHPVHLLAHDWGSIQSWPTLVDPRVQGRVTSFTSISGPSLDHAAMYLRSARRHPRAALRQVTHSFYMFLFQVPRLPELAARRGVIERGAARLNGQTTPDLHRTKHDAVNGIQIYRANMLRSLGRPKPERVTIPVQVIAPKHDPHVDAELQTHAPERYVSDLRTHLIDGNHWVVAQQPDVIARHVEDFLDSLAASPARQDRRA